MKANVCPNGGRVLPSRVGWSPQIKLLTGEQRKAAEIGEVLGEQIPLRRFDVNLTELQISSDQDKRVKAGPQYYAEVAREGAISKAKLLFDTPRSKTELLRVLEGADLRGLAFGDTTCFVPALEGYPHLDTKSFFKRHECQIAAIEAAKRKNHFGITSIVTIVVLLPDPKNKSALKVVTVQSQLDGFMPPNPRGNGWDYDKILCAGPVLVAEYLNRSGDADRLRGVTDVNYKRVLEADKLGLLISFAENPKLRAHFSPRRDAARKLLALLTGGKEQAVPKLIFPQLSK